MVSTKADSLTEKLGKETVKEDPAKTLSSQRECVCYKAVPSEGWPQRLCTVGEIIFTKMVQRSVTKQTKK